MGKQAVDAARGRADFEPPPETLYVETRREHDLFDSRSVLPVTEGIVEQLAAGRQQKDIVIWRDGDKLRVIDGHQTLNAALELNRRLVRAGNEPRKVRITLHDFSSMAEAVIFARNANKRVTSPPSVMAQEIVRMRRMQIPDEEIAKHFDMETAGGLKPYVALARCIPAIGEAVDGGHISMRQAVRIAEWSQDEQPAKLAEALAGDDKGGGRKAATQTGRPTAGAMRKLAKHPDLAVIHYQARAALQFGAGQISAAAFAEVVPDLAKALGV